MSGWGDEIEAAVHPGVWNALLSGNVDLLLQELLILLVDVLTNGLPAVDAKGESLRGEEELTIFQELKFSSAGDE